MVKKCPFLLDWFPHLVLDCDRGKSSAAHRAVAVELSPLEGPLQGGPSAFSGRPVGPAIAFCS
jgi:hypothetical protein